MKDIVDNTEQNRLIAKFLGYAEGFAHKTDEYGYHQCEEGFNIPHIINWEKHDEDDTCHEFLIEQLKFHTSWDWLMPVVEKIEAIEDNRFEFVITRGFCAIEDKYIEDILEYLIMTPSTTKLSAVYQAVVKFIEWYNNQTV